MVNFYYVRMLKEQDPGKQLCGIQYIQSKRYKKPILSHQMFWPLTLLMKDEMARVRVV